MRIAVSGGRDFLDKEFVYEILAAYNEMFGINEIGVGCAKGVDKFVREYCKEFGVDHTVYHADWLKYGNPAGGIRNEEILDQFKPSVVLLFPGGPGTANMLRNAKKRGIKTIEIQYDKIE